MVATGPGPMLIMRECFKGMPSLPGTGQALKWEYGQRQPCSQIGKLRPIWGLSLKPHNQLMLGKAGPGD